MRFKYLGFFLLASGLFWIGCLSNDSLGTASTAQRNIENLARISLGMTSDQVFQIMRHPYRNEIFDLNEGHYDVWFYVTNISLLDQKKLTNYNLTPLTFKNDVLQGKGYNYYHALLAKEEVQSTNDTQPQEDKALEKALTPPPGSPKAAKPATPPPTPQPTPPTKPKPKTPSKTPPKPTQPTQPQAPTQPTPAKKSPTTPSSKVSMSKKPTPTTPPEPEVPPPKKPTKPTKPSTTPSDKDKVPLTEKDTKMIDQEQEENFDYW